MRLICPNCDAQYEVDDGAIPPGGRDVQCSNCGHAWFQHDADDPEDEAEEADVAEPGPEPEPEPEPAPPVIVAEAPPAAPVADMPEAETLVAEAPADALADMTAAPVRRTLDDNLLAVLREEAAREAAERRADAGRAIETQPELGPLDAGVRVPEAPPPPAEEPDEPVTQRPNARRDLLPDIEEINSTLRPGSEARDDEDTVLRPPEPKRAAFRTGFLTVLVVAVALVILYVMAPQLGARFPATATTLTAYVGVVDALRLSLDGLMQSAAQGLRGLSGEN